MKNKKYIVSIIILVILLITSIGTYLAYPAIHSAIQKNNYDESYINDYVAEKMAYYNYAIDYTLKSRNNPNFKIDDYIQIKGNSQSAVVIADKEEFFYTIKQYQRELEKEKDIFYQAIDTTQQKQQTNTKDDLQSLKNNQELQKKYQWYVQIQFDQDGNFFVNYAVNENFATDTFQRYMPTQFVEHLDEDDETYSIKKNNPKNLIITYAVPRELVAGSDLQSYLTNPNSSNYFRYSLPYIALAITVIMIITLITPIRIFEEQKFLNIISRIKFGILGLLWCLITGTLYMTIPYLIAATNQNLMVVFYETFGIEKMAHTLTPLINIGFWFVFYSFFFILAYMIKYLFNKGFKRYCVENTCIGWLFAHSRIIVNKVINFDLNDDINKSVFKIVLFNFAIIIGISIFFVFGIIFAFIYSIIIFFLLKNKFIEIQDDYRKLLNATHQLSNGNFDIKMNEDVGIFNPLQEEFSHIQEGFAKAVQEEVKSQKTKTELISNVSHDLKTPLTSIITYVDLLKSPQLSDKDKAHYIEILERNSLRLKNLIEDLFEVSKANSGDIKLDFVDVDIISLIKQAQLECQDKLSEKNLDMRVTQPDEKVICSLDSSKTYRIFENLFINISKYALQNTRVYLDITETENTIQIIFKNISEAEMRFNENEIVERFVQGDKSRNTSGSGLGLAIVKSFTELQGGQFIVEIDGDLFKSILIFKKSNHSLTL